MGVENMYLQFTRRRATGGTGRAHAKILPRKSAVLACAALVFALPATKAVAGNGIILGGYMGNPNGSSAAAEAAFAANYNSFAAILRVAPTAIVTYVDYTQSVSAWPANASWQAWSNAQSPQARALRPVIGLPMASIAGGAPTADQQFKAFASGQYDSEITGVVQAWVQQGFKNLIFRPGWEMNIQGNTYAGADPQSQLDWVAAFRHIYLVLKQSASAAGASATVIWNPSATNYSDVSATRDLYPGDDVVDAVGIDIYSDMYPYSDGGSPPTYHDWHTGGEDGSIAQFIADPVNRWHYWCYPAATKWSLDSSNGHAQSFASLVQFALHHSKMLALPETGAGNSNAGTDIVDDATFPQWLATKLTAAAAAGVKIFDVNIWNSNGGGNYEFSFAADLKPHEAAAWGKYFGTVK
jgi:hypothetical protein